MNKGSNVTSVWFSVLNDHLNIGQLNSLDTRESYFKFLLKSKYENEVSELVDNFVN